MADEDLDREKDDETAAGAADEPARTRVDHRVARRGGLLAGIPDPPERGPAAYLAEFVGTFGLVFFVCAVVTLYAHPEIPAAQPGLPATQPFQDWAVIGLVHAFVLFGLIQALALVSGAHFNPAITVAMTAIRQIRPIDAGIYIAVQLVGGIVGAFVVKLLFDNPNAAGTEDPTFGAVAVGGAAAGTNTVALAAEVIGTFFLVWAVVGVAVNPRAVSHWAGFAIGATLGAAVMIFGPVGGAGLNPARAFGPALVGEFGEGAGIWILIWVIGPIVGALLAAFLYFQMFILPGRKGEEGLEPVG
jgi:glycerol uptake facilitator protein